MSRALLLPIARGLCRNWKLGNRREAGTILAHITGSGSEASSIVSSMSRVLKKVNLKRPLCSTEYYYQSAHAAFVVPQIEPVRLLEAHMASLRQVFEDWAGNEPEEPQSDHPSEEEVADFEKAEKIHKAKVRLLDGIQLARRR